MGELPQELLADLHVRLRRHRSCFGLLRLLSVEVLCLHEPWIVFLEHHILSSARRNRTSQGPCQRGDPNGCLLSTRVLSHEHKERAGFSPRQAEVRQPNVEDGNTVACHSPKTPIGAGSGISTIEQEAKDTGLGRDRYIIKVRDLEDGNSRPSHLNMAAQLPICKSPRVVETAVPVALIAVEERSRAEAGDVDVFIFWRWCFTIAMMHLAMNCPARAAVGAELRDCKVFRPAITPAELECWTCHRRHHEGAERCALQKLLHGEHGGTRSHA
mmetsp:Transcript_101912/g.255403  ORF Transcript_101912/g.255403 Transcript_101912/m.255403 type:complete len:271 (+) Transcript_101912:106-918(+)